LGAGVVGLFAVVALDVLGVVVTMVVDLCASVALVVDLCASVALVVGLCASVALVVELIAVVVGLFFEVAIGFDGIDRANVVASIDVGALSTHVVGRLEDLQLLQNFLNKKMPL
jgi:hypothetical protein